MKDLSVNHVSLKETMLSRLLNSNGQDFGQYNNIKMRLLNNAKALPVNQNFNADEFYSQLQDYLSQGLQLKIEPEHHDDIYIITVYSMGKIAGILNTGKKSVVFMVFDNRLYFDIVSSKYTEDPNYIEKKNAISEFLSSGTTGKIQNFVEDYLMSCYDEQTKERIVSLSRYIEYPAYGMNATLAYYIEDDEYILARLKIYKIEKSKGNYNNSKPENAIYLLTTNGAYLLDFDQNMQLKYAETISENEMMVKSKIGRDPIICGAAEWISNRDNDFLYNEIKHLNNVSREEKLKGIAKLTYNFAENKEQSEYAANILGIFAHQYGDIFYTFAAKYLIAISNVEKDYKFNEEETKELISAAKDAVSDTDFANKFQEFIQSYNLDANDILAIVHILNRCETPQQMSEQYTKAMQKVHEKFLKLVPNNLDRILFETELAKKIFENGDDKNARKMAEDAADKLQTEYIESIGLNSTQSPDQKYSGAIANYAVAEAIFLTSKQQKEISQAADRLAILKPLIKENIEKMAGLTQNENLKQRAENVLELFDAQKFNAHKQEFRIPEIKHNIKKTGTELIMHPSTMKKQPYHDFKTWLDKVEIQQSAQINSGSLITNQSYPQINTAIEKCCTFLDIQQLESYIFHTENTYGITSYDGSKPTLAISELHTKEDSKYFLQDGQLYFAVAKELANIKFGFSKTNINNLWRNLSKDGNMNFGQLSTTIPKLNFTSKYIKNYTRSQKYSQYIVQNPDYNKFDTDSKRTIDLLQQKLQTFNYQGTETIKDQQAFEFTLFNRMLNYTTDRIGILISDGIISAVKSIIISDENMPDALDACQNMSVIEYALQKEEDGTLRNIDFALRLQALVSFYISDEYEKLRNYITN